MALDINGYNAVFKKFTDFAQAKVDAGQTKAIADAHLQQPLLGGRRVLAFSSRSSAAAGSSPSPRRRTTPSTSGRARTTSTS